MVIPIDHILIKKYVAFPKTSASASLEDVYEQTISLMLLVFVFLSTENMESVKL